MRMLLSLLALVAVCFMAGCGCGSDDPKNASEDEIQEMRDKIKSAESTAPGQRSSSSSKMDDAIDGPK